MLARFAPPLRASSHSLAPGCGSMLALTNTNKQISVRTISTKRWMRPYLKDLYHRRQMLGPDPLVSRSSQDNWNYPSEISALSHRLQIPDLSHQLIVQALTNQSFFQRKDVEDEAAKAQPSMEDTVLKTPSNEELVEKGVSLLRHILLTYLRAHWPKAPEDFIIAVAVRIASAETLTKLAQYLGLQHVVRTLEFPPSEQTLHSALFALLGIMDVPRARSFILRLVLPHLYEVPLEDVLPLRNPFPVLKEYMRKWEKIDHLEPRVILSGGTMTAMPFYEVAIYANKDRRIVGQSVGEKPWVALDLAAQNGLLRIWQVADEPRVFPYKFENAYAERFESAQKPNHQLSEVCTESTDLSLCSNEELALDPIDPVEMAHQYYTKVRPEVGLPHRRRLRHAFSRGTINRMTMRHFIKPKPETI